MTRLRGFTLVEMVVVISIIGVLLSILVPTLSSARVEARTVQCKARMRSFHQWITMHALDKKYFPVNNTWGGLVDWNITSGSTSASFNGDFATMISPYLPEGFDQDWESRWTKNMFLCPGFDYEPGAAANLHSILPQAHVSNGRVMQYEISAAFGYGDLSRQSKTWWPKRYSSNPKPTQVLMGEIYSEHCKIGYYGGGNRINPHNGATNTLLAGGSVRSLKAEDWPQNNPANGFFYY
jgi:prepilin-type N-terminal cleavage/methylation domain-containing protein